MSRISRNAHIALFLAPLLGIGAWSLHGFGDLDLPADAALLDGTLAKALERHYEAQFPLKRPGTNLWAALDYSVFDEGRPGVMLGRHDWLFSDEEFKPVSHGGQHIESNLRLIRAVQRRLDRHGVELLLAIIPAKARLYPEHLGEERPGRQQRELYGRLHEAAHCNGILAPDLLASLQREKTGGALFLRTDTHWTPYGAERVARHLARTVQRHAPLAGAPQRFVTEQGAGKPYLGDLVRFLPLDPLFSGLLPPPDQLERRSTHNLAAGDAGSALFAEVRFPVVLVGTSYSAAPDWNFPGALRQALGSDILNLAESGQGPLLPMLKYLQSDAFKDSPPQLVIWEFPERYLPMAPDLSQLDPAWIEQLEADGAAGQRLATQAE
ncbi:Alginate biosynthesis protein AlgX precursor [compost metagenome]